MRSFTAFTQIESSKSFLLYGSSGWIGSLLHNMLQKQGFEVHLGKARLQNRQDLLAEITSIKPDHVLCAAGVTGRPNVDWCEDHQHETIQTNVVGTLNLADCCERENIHCTIFATGCIYEYDKDHPEGSGKGFTEEDLPNFHGSFYSHTKALVEDLLKSYSRILVLRVRMPISDNIAERCFITKIRKYERIINIPNSVTVLHELLPAGLLLALKNKTGIYNFTNPGVISHNECMQLYKEIVDKDISWKNFTVEEQTKILKAGRSNNELCTKKLEESLHPVKLLSAKEAVREALERSMETYVPTNILLTGGAGFIGSHVLDKMLKQYPKANITVVDKLDYCSNIKNVSKDVTFVEADITNVDFLKDIFKKGSFDTVLHFAAQSHVDNSFGNSMLFTHANVLGTHNLLECAKNFPVKRFIHVSTDEVYGEAKDNESFCESSLLLPTNPYSASKASAEMLVRAYNKSFGIPAIITRGNNVYGPRQYPEKVIPKFILQGLNGSPMTIQGDGSAKRSFLYVTDVAEAFVKILSKGEVGNIYNIGIENEYSVIEIAELISSKLGIEKSIKYTVDRPFNDRRYSISQDRLIALGWSPIVSWEKGMAETIKWYKENTDYW